MNYAKKEVVEFVATVKMVKNEGANKEEGWKLEIRPVDQAEELTSAEPDMRLPNLRGPLGIYGLY